jgi:SAM-dependent methyltransferase
MRETPAAQPGRMIRMNTPRLYTELASWWPLLSDPANYAEEAGLYQKAIMKHAVPPLRSMLELGSGGGNNASHLKAHFEMTLVDLSPAMLEVSQTLNPECRHIEGDMRDVRLGVEFDVVFIHDAIGYMSTRADLAAAVRTAFVHCRPGGTALFVPDDTKESFRPQTDHGGHDAGDCGLRYLEWSFDPDPSDEQFISYMSYVAREGGVVTDLGDDIHVLGLFAESVWMDMIRSGGFEPLRLPYDHSEFAPGEHSMFMGLKPA